jgi:hypothetical protein
MKKLNIEPSLAHNCPRGLGTLRTYTVKEHLHGFKELNHYRGGLSHLFHSQPHQTSPFPGYPFTHRTTPANNLWDPKYHCISTLHTYSIIEARQTRIFQNWVPAIIRETIIELAQFDWAAQTQRAHALVTRMLTLQLAVFLPESHLASTPQRRMTRPHAALLFGINPYTGLDLPQYAVLCCTGDANSTMALPSPPWVMVATVKPLLRRCFRYGEIYRLIEYIVL